MSKLVVITGASRGLGFALASEFLKHGWDVIGTGRSVRPTTLPKAIDYHQFDASNADVCESFWQQLRVAHPDADFCLVNNAGSYVYGSLTETKAQDYAAQMQGSYFSAVYMTRGLALHVPRARIINVISSSALKPQKNDSAYGAAKAATKHFFHSLQDEFTPEQYRITNLYPDNIATHGDNPNATDPTELAEFIRTQADSTASYYLRDVTIYPQ